MDFDNAKENIMPLAGGRNARCLETVLSAESHHEALLLLQKQREDYENAIHEYKGDDPLEPWFNYIQWIEQSYPSGGKENGLFDVLHKCLMTFENEQKYFQDRRMIKLFIKYIDTQSNPQEYYQELYNQGIGTMVADLYICWAYYYDLCCNFAKADEVFRKGIDARAQPLDELEQAHKHFGFTMSQRILYKDEASSVQFMSSMQERRRALTSLRTHKKNVGSIRTGPAIKNPNPGKIESAKTTGHVANVSVKVFEDENHDPNAMETAAPAIPVQEEPTPRSVVRSIIDSTRKQENMREPGPWNKARLNNKRKGGLFTEGNQHALGFEIMQDENVDYSAPLPKGEDNYSKGIQLPPNFVRSNDRLPNWEVPLYSDPGLVGPNIYPQYEKTHLYPKANEVYCPEEYAAWQWLTKRGQSNKFTQEYEHVWCSNFEYGFHYYPKFCSKNDEQIEFPTKRYIHDEEDMTSSQVFMFPLKEVYPDDSNAEFQIEEIRRKRLREGKRKLNLNMDETIIMQEDLDETQCVAAGMGRDRRSIFPSRRSTAPKALTTIVEPPCEQLETVSCQSFIATKMKASLSAGDNGLSKLEEFHAPAKSPKLPSHREELQLAGIDVSEVARLQMAVEKIRDIEISNDDHLRGELQHINKFEIYEDTNAESACLFKAPQAFPNAVIRPPKARKSVAPMREDLDEGKNTGFAEGETTCSTQTFNFFIKGHAVSTPKHLRKSQSHLPLLEERPAQPELVSPPTHPTEEDALNATTSNMQFPPKQLSIIMETTETNTGSSGTKSSGETQDSEIESTKSNQTTKILNLEFGRALNPILEVSTIEKRKPDQPPELLVNCGGGKADAIEEAIPALMTSLKVFEDKTETVPKMLLAKPSMDLPTNDNFEILFTTTPPKGTMKVNSSDINESLTFSKLSEVAMPKPQGTGKGNVAMGFDGLASNKKEQKSLATGTISKKSDSSLFRSFAINDSMTFSKLGNFSLSNDLEADPMIRTGGVIPPKMPSNEMLIDKPFLTMFETSNLAKEDSFDFRKHVPKAKIYSSEFEPPAHSETRRSNNIAAASDRDLATVNPAKLGSNVARVSINAEQSMARRTQINQSFVVKEEPGDLSNAASASTHNDPSREKSILYRFSAISRRLGHADVSGSLDMGPLDVNDDFMKDPAGNMATKDQSIVWFPAPDLKAIKPEQTVTKSEHCDLGRSIYMESPPKTPEIQRHIWVDDDDADYNSLNNFVHDDIDLDHTKQLIEAKMDENTNPFDPELIKAFLDQIDICAFIETLPECLMVNKVKPLQKGHSVRVADRQFDVVKLIGEGSYGSVFSAKDRLSGKYYAVKQERPANLWEYYICLELKSRISPKVMFGFMNVEYAVIGNNASLLITPFSRYGSLINVCHKVYSATGKNVDEYVVMVIASQLLSIIDHLHASNIIHADVKPDNFLLMCKLAYPFEIPSVQLIDFGVSIDLRLFPPKQTFKYVTRTQGFTCIEMLENRPWTYQPDLFGLAGSIHALLFGKYMDVERKGANWGIKAHMPRYFSKTLWNTIFNTLLNIRDCNSMPNLQYLRSLLEEEIVEKEKVVRDKIVEFNVALE